MWNAQDAVQAWQPFDIVTNGNTFFGMGPGTFSGVVVALALRMKRRFSTGTGSAEIGLVHLAVNATSCYAGATGSLATWDPQAPDRSAAVASMTVSHVAATPMKPAHGHFVATAGTFATFVVGAQCQIEGSALGLLGAGGNNTAPYATVTCIAKATDHSWVDLQVPLVSVSYVAETATFTIKNGQYPLWPLVEKQVRSALEKCATQLRRVPKPVLIVGCQGESDLNTVSAYRDALRRVWTGLRTIFSMRHKGETPIACVHLQTTRRTPWGVPDAYIEQLLTDQQAVMAELGNAVSVNTDKLPLETSNPAVWPRTTRQHNGVHFTTRGYIMLGFMADAAAGELAGIPAHPDGDAAVEFGADGGVSELGGTDGPEAETVEEADGPTSEPSQQTASEASSMASSLREAIANGGDVSGYTINGRTVQMRSMGELLQALRYFEAQEQRARGLRRTKVRFT
jgi:hypothetical protein